MAGEFRSQWAIMPDSTDADGDTHKVLKFRKHYLAGAPGSGSPPAGGDSGSTQFLSTQDDTYTPQVEDYS